jgi:hypothetical protein
MDLEGPVLHLNCPIGLFPVRLFSMMPIIQFDQARFRKWTVLLVILIFGLFAAAQTIHAHPFGQVDDSHCSICLAAHAPAMVVALPAPPVLVASAEQAPSAEPQLPHLVHSGPLFIRPPPAGL